MNEHERQLLERAVRISEENNKILKRVYSYVWWRRLFSIFHWVLIIGIAFGLFYFVQPFIDQFKSLDPVEVFLGR